MIPNVSVATTIGLVRSGQQMGSGLDVAERVAGILGVVQMDPIRLSSHETEKWDGSRVNEDDQLVQELVVQANLKQREPIVSQRGVVVHLVQARIFIVQLQ